MFGNSRTEETRAKISASIPNAMIVYVYLVTSKSLVKTFDTQTAAAEWLKIHKVTVSRLIRSGKVFQGKYIITATPLL
jgi:hypothetical protein